MKKKYMRAEGIILENVMGQYLLCDLERGLFGEVNELGVEIWKILKEWNSPENVFKMLQKDYDIEEDDMTSIMSFLGETENKGFVICE